MTAAAQALIAHVYFCPLAHDSRVRRAIDAALEAGLCERAIGIGYQEGNLPTHEQRTPKIEIQRIRQTSLPFPRLISRSIFWFIWSIKLVLLLRILRPSLIQAHSLASLPAAVIAKWLTGAALVYDAHELETERAGWTTTQRVFSRILERALIYRADQILVVSRTIAEWYRDRYNIPIPALVRNIPDGKVTAPLSEGGASQGQSLRTKLGLSADDLLFVYLGVVGYGRGIPIILDAFAQVSPDRHFCAVGYGEYEQDIQEFAKKHSNIHFHPAVPSAEVLTFIKDADVGLSLGEDVCLSYRYSLPNKLFETRMSGLAVLVSDLPEMGGFVREFGGGWAVQLNVPAVVQLVQKLDRQEIERVKATAKPIPTWSEDKVIYVNVLREALAVS